MKALKSRWKTVRSDVNSYYVKSLKIIHNEISEGRSDKWFRMRNRPAQLPAAFGKNSCWPST